MNIKKVFINSFVTISSLSAVLATGFSAYAKNVSSEFSATNFYSYTTTYTGDYSSMYCATNGTSLTSRNSNYDGSYKWVRLSILGMYNDGSYYTMDSREATGTSSSVSTDSLGMTSEVARRIHKAQLHKTSSSTSSVVDNYDIRINK